MIRTRIIGTGSYLPERVVSNREVAASLGIEPGVVARLTGIQERRRAAASQASSDLAVNHTIFRHDDTDEDYWDWLVPP